MSAVSSSSSASSSAPARPQKRPFPGSDFFTPASTSFKPRPYAPHATTAAAVSSATSTRTHSRALDIHTVPPASMDPLPTEPDVLFIHPPFTVFPRSSSASDGLTYQLLTENPEWFLDPEDFNTDNPNAVPYPPHLEPPRGWCPQKKKDLRERGAEGWPEGEEPRLRCTFCRRTYAGVNAKSMWRRHVFEKHKVAMANRRDNSDRPRGRGSNKENRQVSARIQLESHDRLVSLDVEPQTEFGSASQKSKFRSLLPAVEMKRVRSSKAGPSAPKIAQNEFISAQIDEKDSHHPLSQSYLPPPSPPLTPLPSDPTNVTSESDQVSTSSPIPVPTVPPSPYDPLLTPSFRHSPPRLPSEQPWRFPSPSHPLHSRSRELSLSMLIRDSPIVKGSMVAASSPLFQSSPTMASPRPSAVNKRVTLDLDTPESLEKLPRPSPRALFSKSNLSLSGGQGRYRIQESPLQRSTKPTDQRHHNSGSEDWLSEVSLSSSTIDRAELLRVGDPFTIMCSSWGSVGNITHEASPGNHRASISSAGTESPVLRNSALPVGVGLGIGLLKPFTLPGDIANENVSAEEEEDDEAEVASFLAKDNIGVLACESPPPKRRRITVENEA
ncbi:hypothetical protein H0H92_001480 [Tricholoma furcatifolium]|nr:hypothetical protein H0H92_001480 [Tricholoma furcatifolium]